VPRTKTAHFDYLQTSTRCYRSEADDRWARAEALSGNSLVGLQGRGRGIPDTLRKRLRFNQLDR